MEKNKHLTCGQCLKQAVDIQLGVSNQNWDELGKGKSKCGPCLQTVKAQFSETGEQVSTAGTATVCNP
ncbi:hypothetical protein [Neptuniibacter halophilus]|uniref:hypothetical protein n=1 Tax=Neptuniibacter halophilus TaxID=651666 RepID=UPI002573DAA1|nr:hypothetical protein [Neptuniibacter halophilus]